MIVDLPEESKPMHELMERMVCTSLQEGLRSGFLIIPLVGYRIPHMG
jgi:hypothetical protein